MNDFKKLEQRYFSDVEFHTIVNMLYNQLYKVRFTPSEMREAAMLACLKFEYNNPSPIITNPETAVDNWRFVDTKDELRDLKNRVERLEHAEKSTRNETGSLKMDSGPM